MRRFGLIGGTSWHSTVSYYSGLNQRFNDRFNNNTNPPLIIYNMNQALVHEFQEKNNWEGIAELNISAAASLEASGVEGIALCANTPHKIFDVLQRSAAVPIVHIANATAVDLKNQGLSRPLLIGTKFTMSEQFITDRLTDEGIEVQVPDSNVQTELHKIIFDELVYGKINPTSQGYVVELFRQHAKERGADSLILGCTEFGLLMDGVEVGAPQVDSVVAHIEAITKFILAEI